MARTGFLMFTTLALSLGTAPLLSRASAQQRPGLAGVPFPETNPVYHQPVTRAVTILQGNNEPTGHNDAYTRYAWDYSVPPGSPVVAARAGVVVEVRNDSFVGGTDMERYLRRANTLLIDHLDGTGAVYAHLAGGGVRVRRGEYVIQGEWIADSGETGFVRGPHLHFMVVDMKTQRSIPAAFADFKSNRGVPLTGNKVPPAKKPVVPQEVLDAYHRRWRALVQAENRGCPGLAWTFAKETKEDRKYKNHYYRRVLAVQEKSLREGLLKRLGTLAALERRDAGQVIESLRLLETLEDTARGLALRKAVTRLKGTVMRAPEIRGMGWKSQKQAIRAWTDGLREECLEHPVEAAKRYAKTLTLGRGPFRDKALKALHRLAVEVRSELSSRFTLLEEQLVLASAAQRGAIAREADRVYREVLPVLKTWMRAFPDEKDEIDLFLRKAEKRYAALGGK